MVLEPRRRRTSVDDFEWDVVAFVLSWAPYGGPREDEVLPRFGMTRAGIEKRFADVIGFIFERGGSRRTGLSDSRRELAERGRRLLASKGQVAVHRVAPPASGPIVKNFAGTIGRWSLRHGVWHWVPAG